jgi:hypothetical protein
MADRVEAVAQPGELVKPISERAEDVGGGFTGEVMVEAPSGLWLPRRFMQPVSYED